MTLAEYKAQNKEINCYIAEFGEDIPGGFGKKGWSTYGNCDNMKVMEVIPNYLKDGTPKIILGNN